MKELFKDHKPLGSMALHFAPEASLAAYLSMRFTTYHTADLNMGRVNIKADLRCLPFEDASYDFVFASHVLEHIDNDREALSEIRRVLRPGGVAILPVPLVADLTIEYPHPAENTHVRAPGLDYFDRYRRCFSRVEVKTSEDYDPIYQVSINEDRTGWPNKAVPFRRAMIGGKHIDAVPICYV